MGKQKGGIARFIGTIAGMTMYVDDGMFLARLRTSLDKKKWKKLPSMWRQRECAVAFSAASTLAGDVWGELPVGMRRLSEGLGYNALVGRMVDAGFMQDPGDHERGAGFIGMEAVGANRAKEPRHMRLVEAEAVFTHDKWALEESGLYRVAGGVVRKSEGLFADLRISGLGEVLSALRDGYVGSMPVKEREFVIANRYLCDGIVRETIDWQKLGTCVRWRRRTRLARAQRKRAGAVGGPVGPLGQIPQNADWLDGFRVKVWVQAVELRSVHWDEGMKTWVREKGLPVVFGGVFDAGEGKRRVDDAAWECAQLRGEFVNGELVVTGNLMGKTALVDGAVKPAEEMVVYVGLEVSQKEGRHWVRRTGASFAAGLGMVEECARIGQEKTGRRQRRAVRGSRRVVRRTAVRLRKNPRKGRWERPALVSPGIDHLWDGGP